MKIALGAAHFMVGVELVKENSKTIWVKLANGDVIKRHKKKNFIDVKNDVQPVVETIQKKTGFLHRVKSLLTVGQLKSTKG